MKRQLGALALAASLVTLTGCSGQFWGGTAAGAVGSGGAYEINARRQMDKVERDYKEGRIDKREYDIRMDQIKRGSLFSGEKS